MFGSSIVRVDVQTGFRTVCRLTDAVIIQKAVDPFRLRWKILLEAIFIIVRGYSPFLLVVPVCSMRIPVLPIRALTTIISCKMAQFVTLKASSVSTCTIWSFQWPSPRGSTYDRCQRTRLVPRICSCIHFRIFQPLIFFNKYVGYIIPCWHVLVERIDEGIDRGQF